MRIETAEITTLEMGLTRPYRVAYGSFTKVENVLLRLVTDSGLTGWGVSAPEVQVTGETPDTVRDDLKSVIPFLLGRDALRPMRLVEDLAERGLASRPAALAAVDLALWDLMGRRAGLPLWRLLGGYRSSMPTSVTIGIMPPHQAAERAARLKAQGFRCLKLKGGEDWSQDLERLARVREAVGPEVEIGLDANQGYSLEESLVMARMSGRYQLAYLEQPVTAGAVDLLEAVAREGGIPVMADECLLGPEDALRLVALENVNLWNIKIMKAGGITRARRVAAVAASTGRRIMVGCMDESALGIAAGLVVALSAPAINRADLDGHLDLSGDPAAGSLELREGELVGGEGPGLGHGLG